MILVDTSVAIDVLRQRDQKLIDLFSSLEPAFCGIVVAEILHGARDPDDLARLSAAVARFPKIEMPDAIWDIVGRNLQALRGQGLSVPFQDVTIATVAIENGLSLWTRDKQFTMIQVILPVLNLFQEPA